MVLKKKAKEFFGDCKDTMSVVAGNEFTGHTKEAFLVIHVATGRTEAAFTGEGNKFKVTTMRAAKEKRPRKKDHGNGSSCRCYPKHSCRGG